ncbi:Hemin transport system permease protein HmuU|nr:Hemin transport system permease protein HmuU [Candidatus Pantoea persica]
MNDPRALLWLALMLISVLAAMVLAVNLGAMTLSLRALWRAPFSELNIRLPRVLLAVLSRHGALMQGLFRNLLADPGLLGISSGAGLAVAIAITCRCRRCWRSGCRR